MNEPFKDVGIVCCCGRGRGRREILSDWQVECVQYSADERRRGDLQQSQLISDP